MTTERPAGVTYATRTLFAVGALGSIFLFGREDLWWAPATFGTIVLLLGEAARPLSTPRQPISGDDMLDTFGFPENPSEADRS